MENIIQCISAFIACLGFSFVFRMHHHPRFVIIGASTGMFGWFVFIMTSFLENSVLQTFFATIAVTIIAESMARKEKAPVTIFLLTGCFPLFPGRGIYESMLYYVQGDTTAFLTSLMHTFSISVAIALGILLISTIFRIIKQYHHRRLL